MNELSNREAIRIALTAQGLSRPPRAGRKTRAHLDQVVGRIGLLQMDSVNVLTRAHYMPLFSRLAGYDPGLLESDAWDPKRRGLFEYWGHEASLLPLTLQPFMRWRMARAERLQGLYSGIVNIVRDKPDSSPRSIARSNSAARWPPATSTGPTTKAAAGGAGPTPRSRWNICSGPAASPPPQGAGSNGSMT